jgi:hypothetical protein
MPWGEHPLKESKPKRDFFRQDDRIIRTASDGIGDYTKHWMLMVV